jgi:hypothetical protein
MVEVFTNTLRLPGSNPSHRKSDRHDEGEVHENREREGGPRTDDDDDVVFIQGIQ